jgi:hypothetical protein
MLTDFHKEFLDEIIIISKLYRSEPKPDYVRWNDEKYRKYVDLQGCRGTIAKDYFKCVIRDWLGEIVASIRFESFDFDRLFAGKKNIYVSSVGIYNNVGSIDGKGVLNKVYLATNRNGNYFVRSHKVRTDKNYLSPFEDNFCEFFQECMDYLNG